jgi:hypothetical protein
MCRYHIFRCIYGQLNINLAQSYWILENIDPDFNTETVSFGANGNLFDSFFYL